VRRVLVLVVCLGLGGCAAAVGGEPVPGAAPPPRVTSTAPSIDAGSREAVWMNGFCGVGKLLITAGETAPKPTTSSDPAVLKKEFTDTAGRLVNVLDAALTDLRRLRPAPAGGLDDVIGTVIDHMSAARDTINHAKSTVDATEPLTEPVYSAAVQEFGRGVTDLQQAVDFLKVIKLPDVLLDAAAAAPNCTGPDGFPAGTR
jgi:hypothetical protein